MAEAPDRYSGYYNHFHAITRILVWRQLLWGTAFYGNYVLLIRYFLDELHYSEADTLMMLGAFWAAGPVFAAIGGFVADRYIGSFRAICIGYSVYTIGFFLLGAGAYTLSIPLSIFFRCSDRLCPWAIIDQPNGITG
ncbi:Dipeptide and tripeptide permease B [invertebrate metagenome]|uniref:Dipeptide and tripeptide permease B n=1 Tax=invertebrate metagenome TaxID=1711999 RepID=A0A2H9T9T7_9ZZZZ